MRYLLDIAYAFAALAVSPILFYRMIAKDRYRTGWSQRFGRVSRKHPDKKCIWIHAVSVGEVNATRTVVDELKRKLPDYEIIVSTTTDTGFARATSIFAPEIEVFYFPLDFSCISRRAFARLKPTLCILMELEVWPNFLTSAKKLNAPVVVVNGRISDHSLNSYRRIKPIAKAIFSKIALILAQTEEYAQRFQQIGCPAERIVVTGSLKYDTAQITDKVEGADQLAQQLSIAPNQPLLVAGATGNNEEALILDTYKKLIEDPQFKNLRLAIVPRKPERFDEVAQLIQSQNFNLIRYSQVKNTTPTSHPKPTSCHPEQSEGSGPQPGTPPSCHPEPPTCHPEQSEGSGPQPSTPPSCHPEPKIVNSKSKILPPPVILGDTMGDLRKFYSLSSIIFVGRTLVPMGGSDMMEAAALEKPTIFGPHATNFRQTVDALLDNNAAILVNNPDELLAALKKCITNPQYAAQIAQNGRQVIKNNQGATQKTVTQIAKLLQTP